MRLLLITALFLIGCTAVTVSSYENHKKVLLTDVPTLVLTDGLYTTARRTAAIPQMFCAGSQCHYMNVPTTMQCRNTGHNGVDVTWECKATLHPSMQLGKTTVKCEGYDYPEDPYVLAGSCGVEYQLVPNTSYRPEPLTQTTTTTVSSFPMSRARNHYNTTVGEVMFTILFVVVFMFVFYATYPCGAGVGGYYDVAPRPIYTPYYTPVVVTSTPSYSQTTTTTSTPGSSSAPTTSTSYANTERR